MTKSFAEEVETFLAEEQNTLEHAGVKGMKWGHRKAAAGGSGGSEARSSASRDIKDARKRQEARLSELQTLNKQYKAENTTKGRAKVEAIIAKKGNTFLNGQDAITASRKTTGEKVADGIGIGIAAAVLIGSVAIKVAADSR